MNILIAGIGNIFEGDDAFGCEVARALRRRALPDNVRVIDFGIRGLDLTYALLDKPDLTILLDATQQGGAPGNTLYNGAGAGEPFCQRRGPAGRPFDGSGPPAAHGAGAGRGTGTYSAGGL